MKNTRSIIITGLFAVMIMAVLAFSKATNSNNETADRGFAVVELFTSEGCSSCPPADAAVAKIQKQYAGKPVYILAFHVDYWNRLGWKDVFSNADYSKRQQAYAAYLNLQSVYTPQIVVNGTKEFVGSEEGTLRNAINAALATPPSASLTFSDVKTDQNKTSLHYITTGNTDNTVLILAIVEKAAQTSVKAGENKGRNLLHVQIVRAVKYITLPKAKIGNGAIALPAGFNTQNGELIGLLQNGLTGQIISATKTGLPVNI
jgi:hypothetical protein